MSRRRMVWRARTSSRVLTAVIFGGLLAMSSLLIFDGASSEDSLTGVVIALASPIVGWVVAFRPFVELSGNFVVVQNPVRRHTLDLREITGVRAGYSGLAFETHYNWAATAWAVQKSNISGWLGRPTRGDHIAAEILAAAERSRSEDRSG